MQLDYLTLKRPSVIAIIAVLLSTIFPWAGQFGMSMNMYGIASNAGGVALLSFIIPLACLATVGLNLIKLAPWNQYAIIGTSGFTSLLLLVAFLADKMVRNFASYGFYICLAAAIAALALELYEFKKARA